MLTICTQMKSSADTHYYIYRVLGITTVLLLVLQVLLILVSWLVAAAAPQLMVHSLLSAEGVRWFVGHLSANLQTSLLVWGLLLSVSGGVFLRAWRIHRQSPSRPAVRVVVVELLVFLAVLLLLSSVPHALLLSVTGNLFPSSFSDGLLGMICFAITVCSLSYCAVSRNISTLADAYAALCSGVRYAALFLPVYIVAAQLFFSVLYVFGL